MSFTPAPSSVPADEERVWRQLRRSPQQLTMAYIFGQLRDPMREAKDIRAYLHSFALFSRVDAVTDPYQCSDSDGELHTSDRDVGGVASAGGTPFVPFIPPFTGLRGGYEDGDDFHHRLQYGILNEIRCTGDEDDRSLKTALVYTGADNFTEYMDSAHGSGTSSASSCDNPDTSLTEHNVFLMRLSTPTGSNSCSDTTEESAMEIASWIPEFRLVFRKYKRFVPDHLLSSGSSDQYKTPQQYRHFYCLSAVFASANMFHSVHQCHPKGLARSILLDQHKLRLMTSREKIRAVVKQLFFEPQPPTYHPSEQREVLWLKWILLTYNSTLTGRQCLDDNKNSSSPLEQPRAVTAAAANYNTSGRYNMHHLKRYKIGALVPHQMCGYDIDFSANDDTADARASGAQPTALTTYSTTAGYTASHYAVVSEYDEYHADVIAAELPPFSNVVTDDALSGSGMPATDGNQSPRRTDLGVSLDVCCDRNGGVDDNGEERNPAFQAAAALFVPPACSHVGDRAAGRVVLLERGTNRRWEGGACADDNNGSTSTSGSRSSESVAPSYREQFNACCAELGLTNCGRHGDRNAEIDEPDAELREKYDTAKQSYTTNRYKEVQGVRLILKDRRRDRDHSTRSLQNELDNAAVEEDEIIAFLPSDAEVKQNLALRVSRGSPAEHDSFPRWKRAESDVLQQRNLDHHDYSIRQSFAEEQIRLWVLNGLQAAEHKYNQELYYTGSRYHYTLQGTNATMHCKNTNMTRYKIRLIFFPLDMALLLSHYLIGATYDNLGESVADDFYDTVNIHARLLRLVVTTVEGFVRRSGIVWRVVLLCERHQCVSVAEPSMVGTGMINNKKQQQTSEANALTGGNRVPRSLEAGQKYMYQHANRTSAITKATTERRLIPTTTNTTVDTTSASTISTSYPNKELRWHFDEAVQWLRQIYTLRVRMEAKQLARTIRHLSSTMDAYLTLRRKMTQPHTTTTSCSTYAVGRDNVLHSTVDHNHKHNGNTITSAISYGRRAILSSAAANSARPSTGGCLSTLGGHSTLHYYHAGHVRQPGGAGDLSYLPLPPPLRPRTFSSCERGGRGEGVSRPPSSLSQVTSRSPVPSPSRMAEFLPLSSERQALNTNRKTQSQRGTHPSYTQTHSSSYYQFMPVASYRR